MYIAAPPTATTPTGGAKTPNAANAAAVKRNVDESAAIVFGNNPDGSRRASGRLPTYP